MFHCLPQKYVGFPIGFAVVCESHTGKYPTPKLEALKKYCAFGARPFFTLRKGVSGDHVNYLTPVHWRRMDVYFARRLGDLPELQPLWESVGMKAKL